MTKILLHLERPPDFAGVGSFRTQYVTLDLECAFFLPSSETAKTWVLVRTPGQDRNPLALDWKFGCELKVGTSAVSAEDIYHAGYVEWDWGQGSERTLVGDITKVMVRRGDAAGSPFVLVRFAITPSALLRSADFTERKDGRVLSRQVVRAGPICNVGPGMTFRFASVYRLGQGAKFEWNVEGELVEPDAMADPKKVLSSMEDVLLFASLAERRVLLLTGWHADFANGASVTSYRRDFTAPPEEEADVDETLISLGSIEKFLNGSIAKLVNFPHPGAMKQAIQFALHGQGRGIGDSFVMLFAGIETLLNLFGPGQGVEAIVPRTEWKSLFSRMADALAGESGFKTLDASVRSQLLQNVRSANRAFFADRFRRLCSSGKIELSDLWPMVGGQASLYAVRNRIVHGRVFSSDQDWFRLASAKYHLLWTLERSILCLLGWPVEYSRVSPQALRGHTLYSAWRSDRTYFEATK